MRHFLWEWLGNLTFLGMGTLLVIALVRWPKRQDTHGKSN